MTRYVDDVDGDRVDLFEVASEVLEREPPRAYPVIRDVRPVARPTLEQLIDFENAHPVNDGKKLAQIREEFDLAAVRYYQYLNWAMDTKEALEADPVLIHRLRDTRAKLLDQRASRQFHPTR